MKLRAFASPALLVPLLFILVVDLWTKAWAWGYVDAHRDLRYSRPRVVWIEDLLLIAKEVNTGTLWGLGSEYTHLLIGFRMLILAFLLFLAFRTQAGQVWRRIGLGLVLGGALGNLHDNLLRADRGVRDFIDVKIPLPWAEPPLNYYDYPVFNIADSAVLVGAVILFFAFGSTKPRPESPASGTQGGSEGPS
ncbi:MAG: signal peptidase II [Planctomycetota bacterium]|nr:MAG: signal peptidase II [Planctomycetota bacterium]